MVHGVLFHIRKVLCDLITINIHLTLSSHDFSKYMEVGQTRLFPLITAHQSWPLCSTFEGDGCHDTVDSCETSDADLFHESSAICISSIASLLGQEAFFHPPFFCILNRYSIFPVLFRRCCFWRAQKFLYLIEKPLVSLLETSTITVTEDSTPQGSIILSTHSDSYNHFMNFHNLSFTTCLVRFDHACYLLTCGKHVEWLSFSYLNTTTAIHNQRGVLSYFDPNK